MGRLDPKQLGEWLSAYLDGELDAVESQRVEAILQENGEARRMLEELRRTSQLVSTLPRHKAPPSILEDIQLHAERTQLLDGSAARPVRRAGGRGWALGIVSSAAAVALFVAGGWYLGWGGGLTSPKSADRLALTPTSAGEAGQGSAARMAKPVEKSGLRPDAVAGRDTAATRTLSETGKAGSGETAGSEAALLAAATIDQKLRAGLGVPAVESHTFENEPVRLEIAVADAAERDRLTERVARYLADRRVADLSKAGDRGPARGDAPGRFYFAGALKKNFEEADQRQILVRATRRDLEGVMEQVALATGRDDSVALVSGPLEIRGLSRAQTMLYGLADSTPTDGDSERELHVPTTAGSTGSDATSEGAPPAVAPPMPAGPDQFLDQMAQMLGLDQATVAHATPKGDAVASATKSSPAARALGEEPEVKGRAYDEDIRERKAAAESAPTGTREASSKPARTGLNGKLLMDRPSLVERRAKALVQEKGEDLAGPSIPGTSPEAAAPVGAAATIADARGITRDERPSAEPMVTLVIRIMPPKARDGARPAETKPPHPPAKPGVAKPPTNSNR